MELALSEVWLQNMTWEDFQSRMTDSSGIVIVPVGSTEQHGRHLPLGSDTFVAMAIAEEAAKRPEPSLRLHYGTAGVLIIRFFLEPSR